MKVYLRNTDIQTKFWGAFRLRIEEYQSRRKDPFTSPSSEAWTTVRLPANAQEQECRPPHATENKPMLFCPASSYNKTFYS